MNKILSNYNLSIRKNRPLDNSDVVISTFKRGNLLQLTFHTLGCKYSTMGTCSMCNYGKGTAIKENIIMTELEKVCESEDFFNSTMLLLGASGSFLDEYEIPKEIQYKIINRISKSHIEEIFIETHYKSIKEDNLKEIREIASNKIIHIEMGLETTNKQYQRNILNKEISLVELDKTIHLIHKYNMPVSLNILLGMPFLTLSQQIFDAKKSIKWALNHKADYIVIFPVNIQPYTLFEWWYVNGYMQQTSPWLLVELLMSLSDEELKHICLAWYGNRKISYSPDRTTRIPYSCQKCQNSLVSFFEDFTSNYDIKYRKEKLNDFYHKKYSCNCKEEIINSIKKEAADIKFNRKEIYKSLEKWRNTDGTN